MLIIGTIDVLFELRWLLDMFVGNKRLVYRPEKDLRYSAEGCNMAKHERDKSDREMYKVY